MIVENQLTPILSENIKTAAILIVLQISKNVHQRWIMDFYTVPVVMSCE